MMISGLSWKASVVESRCLVIVLIAQLIGKASLQCVYEKHQVEIDRMIYSPQVLA